MGNPSDRAIRETSRYSNVASERETAFVLPASEAAGGEPIYFPGFPGVWYPDQPIAVSELGFENIGEARKARDELAAVLKETKVDVGKALMPERPNHMAGAEEAPPAEEVEHAPLPETAEELV